MAEIYFTNPNEIYRLTPEHGYFSSSRWDAIRCCEQGTLFPESNIIDKLYQHSNLFDLNKEMIDIGANVGTYTISIGSLFQKVYAFEPNLYFNYLLHANVALCNMIDMVDINKNLLSDTSAPVSFNGFVGDLGDCERLYSEPEMITGTTLDSFNYNNIGFIKIDVEGMEERVLRGGEEMLKNNDLPPILFEAWRPDQADSLGLSEEFLYNKKQSLYDYLYSIGYDVYDEWGQFDTHLAVKRGTQLC